MERLILICDGGVHTLEYIHKHKIYPGIVIFDINKFQEIVPYLHNEDEILLIIKGLTDFKMSEVYALLKKFQENEDKVKSITILSNITLGVIPYEYYLYEGDLFFGNVKLISGNEEYQIDEKGNIVESKGMFRRRHKNLTYNPISHKFRKFNDRTIRSVFYGNKVGQLERKEEDEIIKNIILVDIYK